ncbi:LpxI family protein [Pararhodobacter zhoushanensis]|uniref:LpxI family protein n=1 Tax=Pararhodobacter zhoushanensis TaxID=2479545 RepID=UPI000F8D14E9|nr:UDP-2,3-diacylglucosamine diphosphatase LpxI [Pararhodobacter zhoushanensis]
MSRIALIAGAGALPAELAALLDAPLICAPAGVQPQGLAVDMVFNFERLSPFLRALGDQGIDSVALVGAIHRPRLDPALFDRETAMLVPQLLAAMKGGDDSALRWIIALIEEYDLQVKGLAELAPSLLAAEGVLTQRAPLDSERSDAARGHAILDALAPQDVGQGCVVADGLCLAVEALYGTDAMLGDVARHRAERTPQQGGVFVKRAKLGQDLRADLPAIGPETIAAAQAAGLTAIALQAGRVVVLNRPAVLAAAEAAQIAIWAAP